MLKLFKLINKLSSNKDKDKDKDKNVKKNTDLNDGVNNDKIKVLSIDFDGCLYNYNSLPKFSDEELSKQKGNSDVMSEVIIINKEKLFDPLVQSINNKKGAPAKVIILNGSNRNSYFIDKNNWFKYNDGYKYDEFKHDGHKCFVGSYMPRLLAIEKYLQSKCKASKVILDKFLMSDIESKDNKENEFNLIMKELKLNKDNESDKTYLKHKEFKRDATKFSLIYAQIHRIASQYPYKIIEFEFIDDAYHDYIHSCFKDNDYLLPRNVTLITTKYNGRDEPVHKKVQGHGDTDSYYKDTVKWMYENFYDDSYQNFVYNIKDVKNYKKYESFNNVAKSISNYIFNRGQTFTISNK